MTPVTKPVSSTRTTSTSRTVSFGCRLGSSNVVLNVRPLVAVAVGKAGAGVPGLIVGVAADDCRLVGTPVGRGGSGVAQPPATASTSPRAMIVRNSVSVGECHVSRALATGCGRFAKSVEWTEVLAPSMAISQHRRRSLADYDRRRFQRAFGGGRP